MATLTIRRASNYFGRYRKLKIFLDGAVVARVRSNATVDLEVAPGGHLVQAKMDWARSQPWVVQAAEGHPILVTFSMPFFDALVGAIVPSTNGIKIQVEWADATSVNVVGHGER